MIILEYIEQTWPDNPLLPKDAYERSIVRFWAKYVDEMSPRMWDFFIKVGEEQAKATKTCLEILKTIEEHGPCEKKFFGGDAIGLADLILGWVIHILLHMETITGIKLIEAEPFPSLHLWLENFSEIPAIKENLPDMDRVMEFFTKSRESFIKYVSIVRQEGLEISQPALDFSKTEVNYMEKLSKEEGIQKKLSKDILQYKAHIIKIFAEHRHNWISADLEF